MEKMLSGQGENFLPFNLTEHRKSLQNKRYENKVTTVKEAVSKYVTSGSYLATGGFGCNRIASALLHEIVRQGKKNLGFSGHTTTHDFQILVAGECFDRCDAAYIVGLEARGLSKMARKYIESGKVKTTEWSNASLAWRYKAAAMGLSFIPSKVMLGTDTFKYSAAKVVTCPFTGETYSAIPALSPDVAVIHVHKADVYGNCVIEGLNNSDTDLAKASKHVIVTTERIVDNEEIRRSPWKTAIPYWSVDAVIPVPYGSFPGNMEGEYFSDEKHLQMWLDVEQDEKSYREFVKKYILDTEDFYEYLELCGGIKRMNELRAEELMISSKKGI
ncbi:MAG: CoA transferase subunit A [Oligoflexia bacterium]|nr:CoA transferase subunit A [Oligoflexia bacterium]MBF0364599.1 CoA transferase subunit A [Oligoflexia bacterium]